MLRWSSMALLAAACAGGQTGEITDLAACHEPIGVAEIDAPSAAGAPAEERLAALTTELRTVVSQGDRPYALAVAIALTGEPATLLGGPECARPWLEAPVVIELSTTDGALDETIEGTVLFTGADAAVAIGTLSTETMNGALDVEDGATLRVDLLAEPTRLGGRLSVVSGDDHRALTSF
jgi:hypothetical protein